MIAYFPSNTGLVIDWDSVLEVPRSWPTLDFPALDCYPFRYFSPCLPYWIFSLWWLVLPSTKYISVVSSWAHFTWVKPFIPEEGAPYHCTCLFSLWGLIDHLQEWNPWHHCGTLKTPEAWPYLENLISLFSAVAYKEWEAVVKSCPGDSNVRSRSKTSDL